jgi:hypothetical protein
LINDELFLLAEVNQSGIPIDFDPSESNHLVSAQNTDIVLAKYDSILKFENLVKIGSIGYDFSKSSVKYNNNKQLLLCESNSPIIKFYSSTDSFIIINSDSTTKIICAAFNKDLNYEWSISSSLPNKYLNNFFTKTIETDKNNNVYIAGTHKCITGDIDFTSDIDILGLNNSWSFFISYYKHLPTSINTKRKDKKPSELSIFPNPTRTELNIKLNISSSTKKSQINIIDILGKTILSQEVIGISFLQINTYNLISGVYTVILQTDNEINSVRFVKY